MTVAELINPSWSWVESVGCGNMLWICWDELCGVICWKEQLVSVSKQGLSKLEMKSKMGCVSSTSVSEGMPCFL